MESYEITLCDPDTSEVIVAESGDIMETRLEYGSIRLVDLALGLAFTWFCGMQGRDSLPFFRDAAAELDDYSSSCTCGPGSAKLTLKHMIAFAEERPDGVWEIW